MLSFLLLKHLFINSAYPLECVLIMSDLSVLGAGCKYIENDKKNWCN